MVSSLDDERVRKRVAEEIRAALSHLSEAWTLLALLGESASPAMSHLLDAERSVLAAVDQITDLTSSATGSHLHLVPRAAGPHQEKRPPAATREPWLLK
jgi:hypothetical protein